MGEAPDSPSALAPRRGPWTARRGQVDGRRDRLGPPRGLPPPDRRRQQGTVRRPGSHSRGDGTVYDELSSQAEERLADRDSVVLDGTFGERERRPETRDLTQRLGVRFRLVCVECDEATVEDRITDRDGVSDANLEVHRQFRERFEPVEMNHFVVDNSGSEAETRRRADAVR